VSLWVYAIGGALYYRRTDAESKFVVESVNALTESQSPKVRVKMELADSLVTPSYFFRTGQTLCGQLSISEVAALPSQSALVAYSLWTTYSHTLVALRRVL
jgi:hypothetical protein